MADTAVYVAPSVAAVRALWDRSGRLAGPVIREQLSRFAEALLETIPPPSSQLRSYRP